MIECVTVCPPLPNTEGQTHTQGDAQTNTEGKDTHTGGHTIKHRGMDAFVRSNAWGEAPNRTQSAQCLRAKRPSPGIKAEYYFY